MIRLKNHILFERAKKEAEYFDKLYADADARQRVSNYLVPEKIIKQFTHPHLYPPSDMKYAISLLGDLKGKKLLDYGAGDGWNSICFAKAKAKVWAIDISEKGIDLIKKKAIANGVEGRLTAEVQDCFNTRFQAGIFDIVYGGGILHHLDIDAAGREIRRILHPEGVAVFYEPIRETRVMEKVKSAVLSLTGKERSGETEEECPLTRKRISLLEEYFHRVGFRQFNVLTTANRLFKVAALDPYLFCLDRLMMKIFPVFEKLGMAVVIDLKKPKGSYPSHDH